MGRKRIKISNIVDKQLRVLMYIGKLQKYIIHEIKKAEVYDEKTGEREGYPFREWLI